MKFILAAFFLNFLLSFSVIAQEAGSNDAFLKGKSLYQSKEYTLAIQQLKEAISANPLAKYIPSARYMIADSYLQTGKLSDAKSEFESLLKEQNDFEEAAVAWYQLSEVYTRQNNKLTAADLLLQISSRYPLNPLVPTALTKSANLNLELGKEKEAIAIFQQLIRDYPNNEQVIGAHSNLGKIFLKNGESERAQSSYQSIISNPKSTEIQKNTARLGLVEIYLIQNDPQRALDLVNKTNIQESDEFYPQFAWLRGRIFILSNNWQDGSQLLEQVLKRPNTIGSLRQNILIELGRLYFKVMSFENSREKFQMLLNEADQPFNKFIGYSEGADALLRVGNIDLAFEYSQIAINEYKQYATPKSLIAAANIAKKAGQFAEVVRIYEFFLTKFPQHYERDFVTYETAKLSWSNLGLKSTAVDYLKSIISSSVKSVLLDDALYLLGIIYLDMGYSNDAYQVWNGYENRFPGSVYMNDVLAKRDSLSFSIGNIGSISNQLITILSDVNLQRPRGKTAYQLGKIIYQNKTSSELALSQLSFAFSTSDITVQEREETLFMLADLSFQLRDYSQTSKYLDQAQKMFPNGKYAKQVLGLTIDVAIETAGDDGAVSQIQNQLLSLTSVLPVNMYKIKAEKKRFESGRKDAAINNLKNMLTEIKDKELQSDIQSLLAGWYSQVGDSASSIIYWTNLTTSSNGRYAESSYRNLINYYRGRTVKSELLGYLDNYLTRFNYTDFAPAVRELWLTESLKNGLNGRVAQWTSDFTQYEPVFESNLKLYESAFFSKAKAYLTIDAGKAAEYLKQYINQFPNGRFLSDVYLLLGTLAKNRGDLELAASYYKQSSVYSLGKNNGSADIANLYYQNGNYKDAITEYNNVLLSNNTGDRLFIESRIISCYYKLQNPQLAERYFKQFEGKNVPIDMLAETIVEKANYQVGVQDFSGAIATLDRLIEKYNASVWVPRAMFLKAKALELDGKSELAVGIYQELLKRYPTSDLLSDVYLSLGNFYMRKENYENAIANYKIIVDRFKRPLDRYQSAINNMALAYEKLGFYDLALNQVRSYIEQFPDDPEILDKKIKIGVLLQKLKLFEQAITYLYQLNSGTSGSIQAEIMYNIGETYFAKEDYAKASEIFLSVEIIPGAATVIDWPTTALYMAAQSYEKMNEPNNALSVYEKINKKPGVDPVFKKAAQKEILRLKKSGKN